MLNYLILGAGPAGLSVANRLLANGEKSFLVLEQEETPGGLCRSAVVDGKPFDLGGIHLVEDGNAVSRDFLFRFMPENEWIYQHWEGKINLYGKYVDYPLESNIWQLDIDHQIRYLKDISTSGCNTGVSMPKDFKDWIYWKFGKSISEKYMIPYNTKMFFGFLEKLGTYWLYKLPDVSFEEVLRSCLERKQYGKLPGYGKKMFYYPKSHGFGEVWKRMGEALGNRLICNVKVCSLNFDTLTVNGAYQAKTIISTIPWTEFKELAGMPKDLSNSIQKLKYTSVRLDYYDGELDTDSAWVYYPDLNTSWHRAMVRHNFCPGARGYGTETNIAYSAQTNASFSYVNQYTYPVNTKEKEAVISKLLSWCKLHHVIGHGRWGEWKHHNSDVVVKKGLELADKLCGR